MTTTIDAARTLIAGSARDAREREQEQGQERGSADELWTLAVTHTLVERLPRLTLPEAELAPEADPAIVSRSEPPAHTGDGVVAPESSPDGGLGESGAPAKNASSAARGVPAKLHAEILDERLGRLRLEVARAEAGLDIVISVADSHVKALIEADRTMLLQALKDAGLCVQRVQIGGPIRPGTALAVDRGAPERARLGPGERMLGARRRTYPGSSEEAEADSEGLDFTA